MQAYKLVTALAVGLLAMSAIGACATAVSWVHEYHGDPGELRFVLDEGSELREAPTAMPRSLFAPNRCPFTDAGEILQGDSASGVFCEINELFADAVVLVATKTGLSSTQPPKNLFRATSALLLEPGTAFNVPLADGFDCGPGVNIPVRICGQVHNAEVDTDKVGGFNRRVLGELGDGKQEELALPIFEIHLTLQAAEAFGLVLAEDVGQSLPTFQGPDGDVVKSLPRQDLPVISDDAVRLEYRALPFLASEDLDGLADRPDSHLCREPISFTQLVITSMMDGRLAEYTRLETHTSSMGSGGVESLHRGEQEVFVLARENLKLDSEFHVPKYRTETLPRPEEKT